MKKGFLAICIFLVLCIIMITAYLASLFVKLDNDTIGSIAYNVNKKNYVVYIKENNKYVPYIVLDNKYNGKDNTIIVRQNILGGEDFEVTDNGYLGDDKIYKPSFKQSNDKYEDSEVDSFLNKEYINYLDKGLVNLVNDTSINIHSFNNNIYNINRKFFILSLGELNGNNSYTNNDYKLDYFKLGLAAVNDGGAIAMYWTRTPQNNSYAIINYAGTYSDCDNSCEYGIRPAFTLPSNTKIKQDKIPQLNRVVNIIRY